MLQLPWNDLYIPHRPTPRQLAFLTLPHREALFGGAAGGGKSDALLMAALQYVHVPGYAAMILRRTLSDLKQPEALLDRSKQWLGGTDAKYVAEEHAWKFPTLLPNGKPGKPSVLKFGYIGDGSAQENYQGAEYQFVGFDEVTQHNKADYTYLFSRQRATECPEHKLVEMDPDCFHCQVSNGLSKVPLRMRCTANPGGKGHAWVKQRFGITPDRDPLKARKEGVHVVWKGSNPHRPFIRSFARDNPYVDGKAYARGLDELDPITRAQLRDGDWGASPDARFDSDHVQFYNINGDFFVFGGQVCRYHDLLDIFCTIDPATTSKDGPAQAVTKPDTEPSKTVIIAWGLTPQLYLAPLDMRRGTWEAPEVVDSMVDMYRIWKPSTFVCENNGPGKPIHQFAARRGIPITSVHKHKDKVANSFNAQRRVAQGRVWLPEHETPWKRQFIDEVFTWTGDPDQDDDIVDNLSDACNHVDWDMTISEREQMEELPVSEAPTIFTGFTSNPFGASM